jgi:pyruvate dehydrogenase E1 component alpha subunit
MVARLTARDEVTQAELDEIDADARALIDAAVAEARAGRQPDPAELLTDVYVTY